MSGPEVDGLEIQTPASGPPMTLGNMSELG
jgi:hypothetical protein